MVFGERAEYRSCREVKVYSSREVISREGYFAIEDSFGSSLKEKCTLEGSVKAAGYWAIMSAGGVSCALMYALFLMVKGMKGSTRKV